MRLVDRIDYLGGKIVFGSIGVVCIAFTLILILPAVIEQFSRGHFLAGSFALFVGVCFFALGIHFCWKKHTLSGID